MISDSDQEYTNLRNRLYRQLDSYGLRKKGKENKPTDIKLKVANSSNLFLIKERQPVCQSNNRVLQICLEASIGDPDEFRELILNKSAMKQQKPNRKRNHQRTLSNQSSRTFSEIAINRERAMTIKDNQARKEFSRQGVQSAGRKSVIHKQRYQYWQPPSEGIGIMSPKSVLLDNSQRIGKKRVVERGAVRKKYEALQSLNRNITEMWKCWNLNFSRGRKMRKQNI